MKKILILLFTALSLSLVSCSVMDPPYSVDKNIRKVTLGMTKEQVVKIMHNLHESVGLSNEEEGQLEVISYQGQNHEFVYVLYFLDGKLDRMQKELKNPPIPPRRPH